MRNLIFQAVRSLGSIAKGRDFALDPNLTLLDLLSFSLDKAVCALRGFFHTVIRLRRPNLIFIGKGTNIVSGRKFSLEKGSSIGRNCTIDALSKAGVAIGSGCAIGDYTIVRVSGSLADLGEGFRMGDGSSLGQFCFVGAAGGVCIGSNVIAGQRVSFHAENHNHFDIEVPIRFQGISRQGIYIGDDCWIGSSVVILDGVNIGSGSIIAAGAVVPRGNYPPMSVIAGIPARVIKTRISSESK